MTAPVLRVTVAPDRKLTLPHPSGIKELPGRVLKGGDTLDTSPEIAVELLQAGLITGPGTYMNGMPFRVAPVTPSHSGVRVMTAGGVIRTLDDNEAIDLTGGIPKNLGISSENRPPRGYVPPHDCTGGERHITHHPSDATSEIAADGRAWPNW